MPSWQNNCRSINGACKRASPRFVYSAYKLVAFFYCFVFIFKPSGMRTLLRGPMRQTFPMKPSAYWMGMRSIASESFFPWTTSSVIQ